MKKIWILVLTMAMLIAAAVPQVALAKGETPGPAGSKNCIGYCESRGYVPGNDAAFARLHNPSVGGGCGMTGLIRDAEPPQP